jgi:purine-binding chemotaxis protein CheW
MANLVPAQQSAQQALTAAPSFGAKIRADFIAGMGKVAGKFVILLDIQRVLSVDEMAVLADVGGQAAAE